MLHFVRADKTHIKITFDWANDCDVRKYSFNEKKIKYEDHAKWFNNKINAPDCIYFIGTDGDKNVGQIRLDISENSGIISYSVAKEYRGQGYGLQLLQTLEKYILDNSEYLDFYLIGRVKSENTASVRCFLKCGYTANNKPDFIEFTKIIKRQRK